MSGEEELEGLGFCGDRCSFGSFRMVLYKFVVRECEFAKSHECKEPDDDLGDE